MEICFNNHENKMSYLRIKSELIEGYFGNDIIKQDEISKGLLIFWTTNLGLLGRGIAQAITNKKPVGIPRTFDPRPNPLMTGPPIYQGSIGKVPSTPTIIQNTNSNVNDIFKKETKYTQKVIS